MLIVRRYLLCNIADGQCWFWKPSLGVTLDPGPSIPGNFLDSRIVNMREGGEVYLVGGSGGLQQTARFKNDEWSMVGL